ncbi:MAG TPA: MYXO-CTERM sorting domain-containing protein [Kofleriaceae bacterium]|nr:MYXO-CTERM sorting domain-containing protein [Kofleriaceae bacterium]
MVRRAVAIVCVLASAASADRPVRSVVVQPREAFSAMGTTPNIYLNRCIGDCTVTGSSTNDARTQQSTIPGTGTFVLHELTNFMGSVGSNGNCYGGSHNAVPCTDDTPCTGDTCNVAAGTCTANPSVTCTADDECQGFCDTADATWAAVVQCMTEVYSPYAAVITDQLPSGVTYNETLVAGLPDELGQGSNVLGIAPIASDCSAVSDVISFTFANAHPGAGQTRALDICWTAAQETAHTFGLDHEYQFVYAFPINDNSACMDPMTYRTDCGGEKFFRNADALCGEYQTRDCRCHGTQNSHEKLLSALGSGQSLIPAPTVAIVGTPVPRLGAPWSVVAAAGSRRGVLDVELWLNNYPWTSAPGAIFGSDGQVDPGSYPLVAPANVPPGTIDVVVKAYDDLGVEGDSTMITLQNGPPCTDTSLCLLGQNCTDGRCEWPTPVGQIGDACPYPQYCESGVCSPGKNPYCTDSCLVGKPQGCPSGYQCTQISGSSGYCSPASGGCCSAAGASDRVWLHAGLAALVVGLVTRRRRRARA